MGAGAGELGTAGGAAGGGLGVDWLGQSGFRYLLPGGPTVCVDPYLSHASSRACSRPRLIPVPVAPTQLEAAIVVITHDHVDHFDEITLRPLADDPTRVFVGPSSCREHWLAMGLPAERFLRLDRGASLDLGGVRLTATHAEHGSGDHHDAIGVVIEAGGFRVYQVGDSEYVDAVVADATDLRPDLLTLPINGRMGNMDHDQAAALTAVVAPRVVVPNHYGLFADNTADPMAFVDACRERGVGARVVLMQVGQRFTLGPAAETGGGGRP